ncbi:MAG: uridine diphosphate-N-acetylglucosamine-binding protein YvcK [Actinomycetaceae bacterium]|nr:uridine diphosphate-N-acetylglucosamine-binding protein YvcK [Arcanobacterium sp.]MDD7505772.1 uridine diphosphate-N-acetylglucosamine-binding protein YvcK [Actinomycetaceae bacterium]MDY6143629.1 uridine diphosphate-N-acetylglucosamine-binding protein YvcK [Arcanobacterium sp.]
MAVEIGSRGKNVVALGGGHGLYATLSALKILTRNITAVVTVADDGGSSGRLRKEYDILPPGDLRMALSALCDDSDWGQTWRDVLQYRFHSEGDLDGHALGNLLITGLWDLLDDAVVGLDWVGKLLNIRGRVLPMAAVPITIRAFVEGNDGAPQALVGQVAVAKSHAKILELAIDPIDPPAQSEAIAAIDAADWVIFGPGSWYTSVIPHLLVPRLRDAVCETRARRALVLNLTPDGETEQMSHADHVYSFLQHAPNLALDVIVVDGESVDDWHELQQAAHVCGAEILARNVADDQKPGVHDALNLARAFREMFVRM